MKHDKFARWLKALIVCTTLLGAACTYYMVPFFGLVIHYQYPECSHLVGPWKAIVYLCILPCFAAMGVSWMIADHIQKGRYFCMENAHLFAIFSGMAIGDSACFLLASFFFYLKGINHIGFLSLSLLVAFAGFAVGICTYALSYFSASAARLQEDSDLTI